MTAPETRRRDERDELLYVAWTIIANAGQGDWGMETEEWRAAAERWRDRWHATLPNSATPIEAPLAPEER